MNKKAYMSPETEVVNIKSEYLLGTGSPADGPQAIDEVGGGGQLSRDCDILDLGLDW
ncbi:MAG: hypothetical protein J5797_01765 [Prevotella sp.]|nr:hypothetical protein [Prevotella sp.]